MQKYDTLIFDLHGVITRKKKLHMLWIIIKHAYRLDLAFRLLHPSALKLMATLLRTSRVPEEYAYRLIQLNPRLADLMNIIVEFANQQIIDQEMVLFLRHLKPNYRLILFSNIGQRSWQALTARAPELNTLFDAVITAHEADNWVQKPSAAAFNKCIQQTGINPQKTLLIDDKERNCAQARLWDMHTHCFTKKQHLDQSLKYKL